MSKQGSWKWMGRRKRGIQAEIPEAYNNSKLAQKNRPTLLKVLLLIGTFAIIKVIVIFVIINHDNIYKKFAVAGRINTKIDKSIIYDTVTYTGKTEVRN